MSQLLSPKTPSSFTLTPECTAVPSSSHTFPLSVNFHLDINKQLLILKAWNDIKAHEKRKLAPMFKVNSDSNTLVKSKEKYTSCCFKYGTNGILPKYRFL